MGDDTQRIIDSEFDALVPQLGAIAIEGPKAVGKTTATERRGRTVHRLDVSEFRSIAASDPTVSLKDPAPILLDEWQREHGAQPGILA